MRQEGGAAVKLLKLLLYAVLAPLYLLYWILKTLLRLSD